MSICLRAWGLPLRVKVGRVCDCGGEGGVGGGGGRIIREERGGRAGGEAVPTKCNVSCEMEADGFARLAPGIR